jgi:saccharopine dehydrogenase (NAD+, L-lysine forming)
MRIFVLGAGATGSLLAQLLARQGHAVWCGDRDLERARRFLGRNSPIPIVEVNARNLRAIVRAARGAHMVVNASPAVLNQIVLRAALRLRAHYLDLASHLGRHPFKPEQLAFDRRFREKNRLALINAGVAPGLTNLLVRRAAELLDRVDSVQVRLYESTEAEDPISSWSAEGSFDEATSRPMVYRAGRFHFGKRFGEREWFRFPPPIGEVAVVLAAQDEVTTLPHLVPMREMDVKFGGNEIDRLRRWYRQGKLSYSRGLVAKRFPKTPTPRMVARLIRRGVLRNARFAAAVVVRGERREQPLEVRWDAACPSLYQIRRRGLHSTPIAYASAHIASLFIRRLPRGLAGVVPPEALPAETRRAILAGVKARNIQLTLRVRRLKRQDEDDEY